MNTILGSSLLGVVVVIGTLALPSVADAGTGTGACQKALKLDVIALLDSPNDTESEKLGDAISDGFFGNEPNLLNTDTNADLGPNEVDDPGSSAGSVVGSASPGPATIGGGFLTWGTIQRDLLAGTCSSA